MSDIPTIDTRDARRLALFRAGLLDPASSGLPRRASGRGKRARMAAHAVVERFGYLQLDSVSVTGTRTHGIVLASRLEGFDAPFSECLLQPGEPFFEYWGHEASWIPMSLYPAFGFRRQEYSVHPWWGDLLGKHPKVADALLKRVESEGPLRSMDLEGERGPGGWWGYGVAKKVMSALWSAGHLAVRERRGFQRYFDLTERVIPEKLRFDLDREACLRELILRALSGHGWASRGTIAATWRFKKMGPEIDRALEQLVESGEVSRCRLESSAKGGAKPTDGFVRTADLAALDRLRSLRPRRNRGVLLSPFDPVLWDRARTLRLFDFEQKIEIYKPAEQRIYGYYCLPILAGEHLIGRVDTKAHRPKKKADEGRLEALALHFERSEPTPADRQAARIAIERFADQVGLPLDSRAIDAG